MNLNTEESLGVAGNGHRQEDEGGRKEGLHDEMLLGIYRIETLFKPASIYTSASGCTR